MTTPVAPALDPAVQKLRQVRDLASLVTYLHDELEWPVAEYNFEDLVFDITPQEAGLDASLQGKVRSIKRLRPLSNDQPWGIFFIDFVPGELPITVLRRILRAVSIKKREQGRADRKAWQTDDLLFISVLGDEGDRDLNLAHFNEDPAGKRATLRVVEWDADDTAFAILRTRDELKNLAWRRDGETDELWRERWSKAFALRPREVAQTAKALASQMAQLAKLIRERVNEAIKVESEAGPLRELHTAFKEVLLHDLTEDGFADMYAQTMTYGLFAARQSRPMGITLDNAVDMIPNTNPFLRDLLAQFTTANGLTHSLDFDELGVDALVDALNQANIEAVVADFGRAKPGEDPVIHFYEDFLREYNKKQKIQRGVFYTPKPVVSFIVRSVHELLQTEFQLPDGLASTETWADMVAKFPELKIPEGATPETPFVQVLDPACGTGTFLVEVIQLIHDTMTAKWAKQGIKHASFEWQQAWNEYVAKHLLPRIYGFEIMMASYTIAHLKVGLKLGELGYKFAAAERLRIYLTNTLEPPQDFRGMFDIMVPALAHEAHAVNEVKRTTRFTAVVGNPPYSNFGRANRNPWILQLLQDYKLGLNEKKLNLDDDFIKFLRYAHYLVVESGVGIIGHITNNTYIDGITHRRMRFALISNLPLAWIIDLHGSSAKRETGPDGTVEENVFDIQQGVGIACMVRPPGQPALNPAVWHGDVWGSRPHKYQKLAAHTARDLAVDQLPLAEPHYFFCPKDFSGLEHYQAWFGLTDVFLVNGPGVKTERDAVSIHWTRDGLVEVVEAFKSLPDPALRSRFGLGPDSRDWKVSSAKADVITNDAPERYTSILYRIFDQRQIWYSGQTRGFIGTPGYPVMRSMLVAGALGLISIRQYEYKVPEYCYVFATRSLIDNRVFVSNRGIANLFPLYAVGGPGEPQGQTSWDRSNFSARFQSAFFTKTPSFATREFDREVTPEDVFHYIYAVLHSPSYRRNYAPLLKIDFPRIPLPAFDSLFSVLSVLGRKLTESHLLESEGHGASGAVFFGARNPVVRQFVNVDGTVELGNSGFRGVTRPVWEFFIGGYQPAQKWLKDRRGRVLTDEDIEHYKRIIGAITETIRIQKEIDEVIEAHGGWPAAFQGGESSS